MNYFTQSGADLTRSPTHFFAPMGVQRHPGGERSVGSDAVASPLLQICLAAEK